jgi:hypothetical protein
MVRNCNGALYYGKLGIRNNVHIFGKDHILQLLGNVHLLLPCYFTVLRTEDFNIQNFNIHFLHQFCKKFNPKNFPSRKKEASLYSSNINIL